mmetsp:Transcript_14434/g.36099  ORF Transcript_14434/g.36099 Transcript_14434/m.36099 type:complete len:285 (-) Transcript_14434:2905-3759(-)
MKKQLFAIHNLSLALSVTVPVLVVREAGRVVHAHEELHTVREPLLRRLLLYEVFPSHRRHRARRPLHLRGRRGGVPPTRRDDVARATATAAAHRAVSPRNAAVVLAPIDDRQRHGCGVLHAGPSRGSCTAILRRLTPDRVAGKLDGAGAFVASNVHARHGHDSVVQVDDVVHQEAPGVSRLAPLRRTHGALEPFRRGQLRDQDLLLRGLRCRLRAPHRTDGQVDRRLRGREMTARRNPRPVDHFGRGAARGGAPSQHLGGLGHVRTAPRWLLLASDTQALVVQC